MQPNLARLFALDGRRALVTGASSGLGRHFAMTRPPQASRWW